MTTHFLRDEVTPLSLKPTDNAAHWKALLNSPFYGATQNVYMNNSLITTKEIDLILEVLKPAKNERILDVACGTARHSLELARRGYWRLFGIDMSSVMLASGMEKIREGTHLQESLNFVQSDICKLALADHSFDSLLYLGNSLCMLASSQDALIALAECRRVLRPGGQLFLDVTDSRFAPSLEMDEWYWLDENTLTCRKRRLCADGSQLITWEFVFDRGRGLIGEYVVGSNLYSQTKIETLLSDAGFKQVELVRELNSDNLPPQPGMMAHRLLFRAFN